MNAGEAAAARRDINAVGQSVSFRRMTTTMPQTVSNQADVKAAVEGYKPEELQNGITQGHRRIIVSILDLQAANWPLPVKKGDRIVLSGGRETTVQTVDPDHREYLGCLDISVSGA